MNIPKLQKEERKRTGDFKKGNQQAASVAKAGNQKKKKENHVRGLSFFKAVVNNQGGQANVNHKDKDSCKNTDRVIAKEKMVRKLSGVNFGQADSMGKKLIKSEKGSKHETRNCGNKKDESHSVSESDCHDLKIT